MSQVFISYRRKDSRHVTDRLYDRLVARMGTESVFKDVDSIPLGTDFRRVIEESVGQCDVLLAVIGEQWLDITDEAGQRRLDDSNDLVRIELETALSRGIPVIPILVDGAEMPKKEKLPNNLQPIASRNGTVLRPDPDFHHDMDRVIRALEEIRPTNRKKSKGFCYINKEGIDDLCSTFGLSQNPSRTYGEKIQDLLSHLECKRLIGKSLSPTGEQFVSLTASFKLVDDDEEYLSFRPRDLVAFRMNMRKTKSTLWPYASKMSKLAHVRIAMQAGVEFEVFGEWQGDTYLRPHAVRVVGGNLGSCNALR